MQDTDAPHKTDDPTPPPADGVGYSLESEAKGEDLDPGSNVETSGPGSGGTIQVGEVSVQLVTPPRECMDSEISQEVMEVPVVPVDPLQITSDRVLEHPSGSGSKPIFKPNQGGKGVGRQRGRKQRQGGSVKVQEIRSSPSQLVKPYDNFADQSSEDNENRSSTKKHAKRTPAATFVYDDNDPSTARRQSQRGDGERSHGTTPSRRLAFAPVPPSELNIRMGTTPPNQTPEKLTPNTRTQQTTSTNNVTPNIHVASVVEELASPILSLQQAGLSITAQVLTVGDESDLESEENASVSAIEEDTIESALERLSVQLDGDAGLSEHHDSDKENVPVVHEMFLPGGPGNMTLKLPHGFSNTPRSCTREPLQTLYSAPSPSMYQSPDIFTTPTASQKLLRARFQVEAGRQWQMVVDTNSLLNSESLESLKLLEGIRETRLVIPNIVVRELDYLQKQGDWKVRACSALQWIEICMLKTPTWIHVQSSGETVHVAMTPPLSPSLYSRGLNSYVSESDMMHPTLHDHVLECALFQQTMPDGRVAILTDDTTLRIKALAESLVVDTASNFSESLLNPYSDRFVYAGSTPIGRSSSRLHEKGFLYDGLSMPGATISSSKWPTQPSVRPKSRSDTPRSTSRANFSIWRKSQPIGLHALLQ